MNGASGRRVFNHPQRFFVLWLIVFYAAWLAVVSSNDLWQTIISHWPIAAAMAAGSYFAGSTPMGGGTVGFPVLVLLFDMPAALGRNFGLAIQSIGMTSASLYILCSGRKVDWAILRPALLGAFIATPFGAAFIAPYAPDLFIKLLFATIWASFGIVHFAKLKTIIATDAAREPDAALDKPIGFAVGVTGGIIAALTGVGIDMLVYAALVLFFRSDIKVAIPTSVILMAFTSIVGLGSNLALAAVNPELHTIAPETFYNLLAAAPVVVVGAPFGALIVNAVSRHITLLIVSVLCVGQFIWTLLHESVSGWTLALALAALLALSLFFLTLLRLAEQQRRRQTGLPVSG